MKRKILVRAGTGLLAIAAIVSGLDAQRVAQQATPPSRSAGAPPKIINIVYENLIPGKEDAYAALLARIARAYHRANIPVYWMETSSVTGLTRTMSLNFFDSFADLGNVAESLNNAMEAHPDLVPMQEDLLANTSNVTNAFAVRRDDIGYRAAAIDFSRARILRIATVVVRQGYETEFADAMKSLAAAYERVNADAPWVLYQVNAGAPSSTFVFFMPMRSMKEMDDYIARSKSLSAAEGAAVEPRLQEAARNAYLSWDSELFFVGPRQSHVSTEFAAGDPGFWIP
jgi:hypothetical protein